jgi:AcrR family transcriptional regulator
MAIRQRAIQAEDKQERHDAILDAAERLLLRAPDRVANVAEVADEAGLAKGTVYLYFPSKEELLLAVHERNIDAFFSALIERMQDQAPASIDDVLVLTHRHLVEPPLFLPLASRCFGLMGQSIAPEAGQDFKQRMAIRLQTAGAGLERHFPELAPGRGVALLHYSYALIIGLWQMSPAALGQGAACPMADSVSPVFSYSYPDELDRALRALWEGTVSRPMPATTASKEVPA